MLRGADWQSFIDISEQPLCPFCKGPAGLECFTLEDGTYYSETSVNNRQPKPCNTAEKRTSHTVAEA
jgi:uncharacterized protein (UPF0179 family)